MYEKIDLTRLNLRISEKRDRTIVRTIALFEILSIISGFRFDLHNSSKSHNFMKILQKLAQYDSNNALHQNQIFNFV